MSTEAAGIVPASFHRAEQDLPFVPYQDGVMFQLLQVNIEAAHVPDSNDQITDIWFAVTGANLDLDGDGNVETVLDAGTVLEIYRSQCLANGHPSPDVIGA